ncbi:hypothetical protein VCV18_003158 [Metarhizium anisopliae]
MPSKTTSCFLRSCSPILSSRNTGPPKTPLRNRDKMSSSDGSFTPSGTASAMERESSSAEWPRGLTRLRIVADLRNDSDTDSVDLMSEWLVILRRLYIVMLYAVPDRATRAAVAVRAVLGDTARVTCLRACIAS